MNRYNKISPDVRKELESKLAARFAKTSKTGMAKRLLKGEDVENHLTKTFKEHSEKTTKDIDKKTQDAIVSINQRIDAVLKYMQSVVQAKVDGIRVPEDGRTPSADEIKALLSPMVDETRTQFTQRISKIEDLLTKAPKESDVPTDLKGLEAFVKSKIPKLGGGGGGASYLFELFDTPAKSKSRQGAYVGYEGLVLAVSDDGKGLVFQESGSSLPNQTGNAGKFLKSTGTEGEEEWDTIAGGGDMLAATYDPAAGAKQVAFNDELHAPVTVTDTTEVDLTLTGQAVSAVLKAGSIAKARLVTAVQTSLGLADTATQPGDLATVATSGDYDDLSNKPDLSAFDNISEHANAAAFPGTGAADKFYLAQDTGVLYRWTGSAYAIISAQLALGETSSTAYRGDRGKTAFDHVSATDNPHSVSKAQVGLSNVPNTDFTSSIAAKVSKTGNETVAGVKTFSSSPIIPAPTTDLQAATKKYVDDNAGGGSGGITWNEVTGTTQAASVNAGYIANNAALVTITIPTTAAVGDVVRVTGKGAGGWKIAQNASEIIHFLGTDTTRGTGGSLASTGTYDGVEIVCVVANTEWVVASSMGNITIV